jgi:cyclic di-GMP phosphodiesterase Gmr
MDFIPYAEESGLIVPLGLWVLNTAAAQSIEWQRRGINLRIAVNMSARQLEDPSVLQNLSSALSNAPGYKPLLDIELTESWLVDNQASALELIEQFRELGVQVHLDDFGTGYSSLSQLARLPMDVIKMDRSFINSVSTDAKARALVRSMSAVAKELNVKIVAEGVETAEQADFLRDIAVDYVQGYLYARPVSVEAFEAWYRDRMQASTPIPAPV